MVALPSKGRPPPSKPKGRGNISLQLRRRETGLAKKSAYGAVPGRLRYPIEGVVDEARAFVGCILLGFTRCGDFLVTYTPQGGCGADRASQRRRGYHLQLWSFAGGAQAVFVVDIPLFQSSLGLANRADDDDFLGGEASISAQHMELTLCESADQHLLVVHGRQPPPAGGGGLDGGRDNFITVVPSPATHGSVSEISCAHFTYQTAAPHPAFVPLLSVLHSPAEGAPYTLVLNGGSEVRFVEVCLSSYGDTPRGGTGGWGAADGGEASGASDESVVLPARAGGSGGGSSVGGGPGAELAAGTLWGSEGEDSDGTEVDGLLRTVTRVPVQGARRAGMQVPTRGGCSEGSDGEESSGGFGGGGGGVGARPSEPSPRGRTLIAEAYGGGVFDAEEFIHGALGGLQGYRLVDYDLQVVVSSPCEGPHCGTRGGAGAGRRAPCSCCVVLQVLPVLRRLAPAGGGGGGGDGGGGGGGAAPPPRCSDFAFPGGEEEAERGGAGPGGGGGGDSGRPGLSPPPPALIVVDLLVNVEIATGRVQVARMAEFPGGGQGGPDRGGVGAFIRGRRDIAAGLRRRMIPPRGDVALPLMLSNKSVVDTGKSLRAIVHPAIPICIMGYHQGGGGAGRVVGGGTAAAR